MADSPVRSGDSPSSAQEALAQVRSLINRLAEAQLSGERAGSLSSLAPHLQADLYLAKQGLAQLAQDLRAEQEDREQLEGIQRVSQAITSSLDLTNVLNMVMDTIIELTGAERGFLMLLNPESGELDFHVARNMDRETIQATSFEISRSIVNRVAEEGEPIVTTNAQADPRFRAHESVVSYHLRSILCVPLKVRDELIGVIYADNRVVTGLFDDQDRDLLAAFANQAAIAIQNARLFEQAKAQLEAITAMKNLQDNVFASIVSGVITTDAQDNIALVNRAAEEILGVPSDEMEGQPCLESLPELCAPLGALIERVKSQDALQASEVTTELPGRGRVDLSLVLSPLKDAQGDTLGVAMVIDDLTEKRRRERTIAHVRRYLPPALVDSLPAIETLQLGGARQTISILFADVRGFSTFSERHEPEKVVAAINRYFTVAADAILLHEGIIDKFMGDAVMALFNTPFLPQEDHALRAVRAALAMMYDASALSEVLDPDQQLRLGVGIHTGEVVLGNIGSPDRLDFSAIGDAVNLAKRLQEVAGPEQILISQAAYEEVKDWVEVIQLDPIQVKGRHAHEQVYELVGLAERRPGDAE